VDLPKDFESSLEAYPIKLEHFEGPLDLLIHLIKTSEVNVYDIPIALITNQYLEYIELMQEMNLDIAGEFLVMAATLIHIKSKLLLPVDPELEKISPEEDPRKELVDRLLEHERFKNAAEMLHQKRLIEEAIWSNPQIAQFTAEDEEPGLAVSLHDLVKTFQELLDRAKNRPVYNLEKEDVSVPDMIKMLRNLFTGKGRSETIAARELFEAQKSRRGMICLFLAMLEMVKRQALDLVQKESFGEIALRKSLQFEEIMGSDAALAGLQEEYT
jgi:segregation and condensation protein A